MSVPRKQQHRSNNSADVPTPISEAEIIDLINHLPFGGERWNTAIDSVVQILDAAKAKDTDSLRRLSSKGGKLPKRLAALAIAFLEQDDDRSATTGPDLALKYFFQFSRQYSFGKCAWMADNRNRRRTTEPSQSAPTTEASDTEATLEEMVETINEIGKSSGPRLQLVAICGYRELISPELATAMLNLAYDALGLPLKPEQKGGEHHE